MSLDPGGSVGRGVDKITGKRKGGGGEREIFGRRKEVKKERELLRPKASEKTISKTSNNIIRVTEIAKMTNWDGKKKK